MTILHSAVTMGNKRTCFTFGAIVIILFTIGELATDFGCIRSRIKEKDSRAVTQTVPQVNLNSIIGQWQLIQPVEYAVGQTLNVDQAGNISGFSGVNNYQGKLTDSFRQNAFAFDGAVAVTMRMGENMAQESAFLSMLNQVNSWRINKSNQLELKNGDTLLALFGQYLPNQDDSAVRR